MKKQWSEVNVFSKTTLGYLNLLSPEINNWSTAKKAKTLCNITVLYMKGLNNFWNPYDISSHNNLMPR